MIERLLPAVTPVSQVKLSILHSIAGNGVPEYLPGAYYVARLRIAVCSVLDTAQPIIDDLRIHNALYDIVDRCEKVAQENVIEFARLVAAEVEKLLIAIKESQSRKASDKMLAALIAIKAGCDCVMVSEGKELTFAYTV